MRPCQDFFLLLELFPLGCNEIHRSLCSSLTCQLLPGSWREEAVVQTTAAAIACATFNCTELMTPEIIMMLALPR